MDRGCTQKYTQIGFLAIFGEENKNAKMQKAPVPQ